MPALLLALLAACANNGPARPVEMPDGTSRAVEAEPPSEDDERAAQPGQPGPVIPTSPDGGEDDDRSVRSVEQEKKGRTRVFDAPRTPLTRKDGRPLWWFDEPRRDHGTLSLCVEAIGQSIRDARRNAIERARREIDRRSDRPMDELDIEYERIWIWPTHETGRTRDRYAAFVMLSVRTVE